MKILIDNEITLLLIDACCVYVLSCVCHAACVCVSLCCRTHPTPERTLASTSWIYPFTIPSASWKPS